jgi:hypothetical protein
MTNDARLLDAQRTRQLMDLPSRDQLPACAGIDESPMPGKSGAMTVNFSASSGMIGRHIRDVSAKPCRRITASGPFPAVR